MVSFLKYIFEEMTRLFAGEDVSIVWGTASESISKTWKDLIVISAGQSTLTEEDTGDFPIEDKTVRIQCFAKSMRKAVLLGDKIFKHFYRTGSTLADGRVISATRDSEDTVLDPDRTAEGEEIWQNIQDLIFKVQRSIKEN